jgi:hypothetical protein
LFKIIVLLLAGLAVMPSWASPAGDALSRCIADSTTGRDRKDLARWVFTAMSAHPEIRDISNVAPGTIDKVSKVTGGLFTKLLTESCPNEVRAAMQSDGPVAIQAAFHILGQLAMQELMTDNNVVASISVLETYIDKNKLEALRR